MLFYVGGIRGIQLFVLRQNPLEIGIHNLRIFCPLRPVWASDIMVTKNSNDIILLAIKVL